MQIKELRYLSVLSEDLAKQIKDFECRLGAIHAGYPDILNWHSPIRSDWGKPRELPVFRSRVYSGNIKSFAYSHHHSIIKFKDRYVVTWSNGIRDEDFEGQEVHYSWSEDGYIWAPERVLVHTDPESGIMRNNAGLYATADKLYAFVGKCFRTGKSDPITLSPIIDEIQLDLYETEDLVNWKEYAKVAERIYLFEGPRMTKEGKLLCCGSDVDDANRALALVWDGPENLTDKPHMVELPRSTDIRPMQGTWYQTDNGKIHMFLRDAFLSCRNGLSISEDGGNTWSVPMLTDFPNTFSRSSAGRLNDGRFFIVGNNYSRYLDRTHMLMAISSDGEVFGTMYTLISGFPKRRIEGFHKENGYHYPNCIVDGDRMYMVYSVNKEDIEVAIIDLSCIISGQRKEVYDGWK